MKRNNNLYKAVHSAVLFAVIHQVVEFLSFRFYALEKKKTKRESRQRKSMGTFITALSFFFWFFLRIAIFFLMHQRLMPHRDSQYLFALSQIPLSHSIFSRMYVHIFLADKIQMKKKTNTPNAVKLSILRKMLTITSINDDSKENEHFACACAHYTIA